MALNGIQTQLSDKAYIAVLEQIIKDLIKSNSNLASRVTALEKRK